MGNFTARLELPEFIPKEQILGKHVFDSEVVCMGLVEDWTYSADGEINMVVKEKSKAKGTSAILIPFYEIDRVGQFILLRSKREKIIENQKRQVENKGGNRKSKNDDLKYFDEIDEKKIDKLAKLVPQHKK